ncbi:MAG: cation:proton antiporter [Clostridia bacterium]|nr:cation:proton antiporter [Clostridia bacterium]
MVFYVDDALGYMMIIAIVLVFTKLFGLLFRKMKLPEVLGYIIAGLVIGPAIFGEFCGFTLIGFESGVADGTYKALFALEETSAGSNEVISIFSKIGVILIMFTVGLETDLKQLKNTGLASILIACAGVAVPFALGFLISLPFGSIGLGVDNIYRCIFIGTILTATSVAITVSVLKELGKISTKLGTTIVSAAVIDDVIGIVVLSIVTSLAKSGTVVAENGFEEFKGTIYGTIIMIIAFFIVAVALGFGVSKLFKWMERRWPNTHRLPIFSLVICFVYSWAAEEIFGVADITGAYLAGVVLSTTHNSSEYTDKKVSVSSYMLFSPIFFANIGISYINFSGVSGSIILFAVLAVLMGLIGKIVGCGAVAKGFGYSLRESTIAGVGMMARGEVALIVTQTVIDSATLGENALGSEFMIMTVLLILVSSILTPILLKVLYKKDLPLQNGPAQGMGGEVLTDEAALNQNAEGQATQG